MGSGAGPPPHPPPPPPPPPPAGPPPLHGDPLPVADAEVHGLPGLVEDATADRGPPPEPDLEVLLPRRNVVTGPVEVRVLGGTPASRVDRVGARGQSFQPEGAIGAGSHRAAEEGPRDPDIIHHRGGERLEGHHLPGHRMPVLVDDPSRDGPSPGHLDTEFPGPRRHARDRPGSVVIPPVPEADPDLHGVLPLHEPPDDEGAVRTGQDLAPQEAQVQRSLRRGRDGHPLHRFLRRLVEDHAPDLEERGQQDEALRPPRRHLLLHGLETPRGDVQPVVARLRRLPCEGPLPVGEDRIAAGHPGRGSARALGTAEKDPRPPDRMPLHVHHGPGDGAGPLLRRRHGTGPGEESEAEEEGPEEQGREAAPRGARGRGPGSPGPQREDPRRPMLKGVSSGLRGRRSGGERRTAASSRGHSSHRGACSISRMPATRPTPRRITSDRSLSVMAVAFSEITGSPSTPCPRRRPAPDPRRSGRAP